MEKQYLKNFKDGVFDAVIYGVQSEKSPRPDGYKQGYDFGLTLWAYEREDAKEA